MDAQTDQVLAERGAADAPRSCEVCGAHHHRHRTVDGGTRSVHVDAVGEPRRRRVQMDDRPERNGEHDRADHHDGAHDDDVDRERHEAGGDVGGYGDPERLGGEIRFPHRAVTLLRRTTVGGVFADGQSVTRDATVRADVCIVGAGAAGITLARELAATKLRVVVLESGGLEYDDKTQELDAGPNVGLPYFPLDAARLRYFGGTTNHWGGVCRPFDAADFATKEWIPRSGWPIGVPDVAPYYDRARVLCHVTTDRWNLADWRARDAFHPLPLDPRVAVTRPAQVVENAKRSFGTAYRDDLRRAANVTTYFNANATELVVDDGATAVTTVRVATLSGNTFAVAARAVVLATGALENARLLLLSDRQVRGGVGNQHDLVGRHFLEHPRFAAGVVLPTDDVGIRFYEQHGVGGARLQGYLALTREIQRREQLCDVQVRLDPVYDKAFAAALTSRALEAEKSTARALKEGRLPRHLGRHLRDVLDDVTTWRRVVVRGGPVPVPLPEVVEGLRRETAHDRRALLPDFGGALAAVAARQLTGRAPLEAISLVTRVEPVPNPDSRVRLIDEHDALGLRKIALDWRLSALDKHSAHRTLEILGAEITRAGLGRVRITLADDGRTDRWPDDLAGGWHHMGTTRMSDDPALGVVDRDLKVHGLTNLYVAGSSVFPTAGSGTPTMLLVALALRLANHVRTVMA